METNPTAAFAVGFVYDHRKLDEKHKIYIIKVFFASFFFKKKKRKRIVKA